MGLYKITRPDGSVEYTDLPSGPGRVDSVGERAPSTQDEQPKDYELAKSLIKEAQKRIPKVKDYLEYLEYLRHNSPVRFDFVMDQLRREDPQTWLKLQKFPQFRPLRETAVGVKAGSNPLGAGVSLASGNVTGSAERWMESTLKDLMKRDRFGPYADVLGTKGSTLPSKVPNYSNSYLGQHLKVEDARQAVALRESAKELEGARAGLRAAKGAAVVRAVGPLVDLGLAMLDPNTAVGISQIVIENKLVKARDQRLLDFDQYVVAHNLMAAGRYKEMQDYLQSVLKEKQ
jgi:hypothetical protein